MVRLQFLEFLKSVPGSSLHLRSDMPAALRPSAEGGQGHGMSRSFIMPGSHEGVAHVLQISWELLRRMPGMPDAFMADRRVMCGEFRGLR